MAAPRPLLPALLAACLVLSESAAHPMLDAQLARAEREVVASPSDPGACHRLAQLYRYRREWVHAEDAFARCRALPGAPDALDLDLARTRLEAGRPDDALSPVARYVATHPEDPEGWDVRGRALEGTRPKAAADAFATALARSASTRPSLKPADDEVARILEIPLDRLMDPASVAWRTMTRDNRSVAVPVFLVDHDEIWGATAMVLAEFLALL